ncbi:uncharacterized protein OCT59_023964 [Rhizophagus irregularis]|uniref:uncharacterized protein n=1 Tax=Rhizophagus irregularis TaxID=588596 RepID=UPI003329C35F|nr:hypothetical protein OCT59_023964 [Rhizophagus irregularis]
MTARPLDIHVAFEAVPWNTWIYGKMTSLLVSERVRIQFVLYGSLNLPDATFQQLGMQSLVFGLVHRISVDFFRT